MKKTTMIIALLISILIGGCQLAVKEKHAIKLQKDTNQKMVLILSEMEKLQTGSLKNYLDEHPTRRFYVNGKSFAKDKLLKYLESEYKGLSGQKLKVIDPRAIVISHTSVLWSAEISIIKTDKEGQTSGEYRTDSWLWQEINDKWIVSHFNLSSSGM